MRNYLQNSILLILMISVSITAIGQYTGSNPNVASFKLATAQDSVTDYEPSKAVDLDMGTYCAIPGTAPAWLHVDLGSFHFIDGYGIVLPNSDELPLTYTIQGSADGSFWNDLKQGTTTAAGTYSDDLTWPGDFRYVRIYITEKNSLASITEFYIYGYERVPPSPPLALEASNIAANSFTANWSERATATGYILSVATDFDFNNFVPGYDHLDVGNVLNWEVTGLSPAATYYYLLFSYNAAGTSGISNKITVLTLQATQTITFNSLPDKTYGDVDFELTAVASSGLTVSYTSSDENVATVSNDTVTIIGLGTTSITASQAGNIEYEAATPVSQDLTIIAKELTVSGAIAANKAYDGTTDATISGGSLTGLVGADIVTLTNANTGTFAQSGVGTAIAVSTSMTLSGADAGNYFLTQPSGLTADITLKDLTVTADDKSREACAANPDFTFTYAGFEGSDDAGVMTTEPVCTSIADETSAAGEYDITVSGGSADNYNLLYVNGTLTISPDTTDPVVTVQNITIQLDEGGNATLTPAEVVTSATDNCGIVDTTLSQSAFTSDDIGEVTVEVTVTDAAGNSAEGYSVVTVEGSTGYRELTDVKVNIYPNPTSGMVELELNTTAVELKVMDMTGKMIISRSNLKARETIDLTGFSNGIYIFQLQIGDDFKHVKVIKK